MRKPDGWRWEPRGEDEKASFKTVGFLITSKHIRLTRVIDSYFVTVGETSEGGKNPEAERFTSFEPAMSFLIEAALEMREAQRGNAEPNKIERMCVTK